MKRLGYLYEQLIDVEYLEICIHKAFCKKKKTKGIRQILADPHKHAERISRMIQNGTLPFVKERGIKTIKDGKQKKERTITKATNYEHIIHHAIIGLIQNKLMNSSYKYAVASIPSRGDLYGKKVMERWIRSYRGRKVYVLKFDIRKFFDSIDRKIMIQKLSEIIKDKQFMAVIEKVIFYDKSVSNHGIPIGYYTSQWFANFYLQSFDNFVKQELEVKHMMRYMDDVVILCQNKRKLRKIFDRIREYLRAKLCLTAKDNWQIFMLAYKPTKLMIEDGKNPDGYYGRPIDFMGYKFYPWKTTIRKSTLRSARRCAYRFARNPNTHNAKSLMSYYGRIQHAMCYGYACRYLYSIVTKNELQKIISKYDKETA